MFIASGAPGRIRTYVGLRPTDLQSVVIDHSTTDASIQNSTKKYFLHLRPMENSFKFSYDISTDNIFSLVFGPTTPSTSRLKCSF